MSGPPPGSSHHPGPPTSRADRGISGDPGNTDEWLLVERLRARFGSWYELFPRSAGSTPGVHGTLRDVAQRLPLVAAMGFDVLYLPPIHPIGRMQRKGRNNALVTEAGDVGT